MKLQTYIGIASLLCMAAALNVLVWGQNFFVVAVLAPLGLAGVLGALWLVLALTANTSYGTLQGRAVGSVNAVLSSLLFLGICVVIYAFAQGWDVSWDLTQEGRRDLAPQTVQVLQSMTPEVEVLCFFPGVQDSLIAIARDKTVRFLDQCQKYTPLLKVEMLDPQVDNLRLQEQGVTHASQLGTVVLKSGTRKRIIMLAGGSPRLEEREFTNALINVIRESEPKIAFLAGHGERDIDSDDPVSGASEFKLWLQRESYAPEKLTVDFSNPEIPDDVRAVVILHPQGDLNPLEIRALNGYLDRGGRVLVLLNPWVKVNPGATGEQLRPWMESRLGAVITQDILLNPAQEDPLMVELSASDKPFELLEEDDMMAFHGCYNATHPITQGMDQKLPLRIVRSVRMAETLPENAAVTTLLRTPPTYYAETDIAKLYEAGQATASPEEEYATYSIAVTTEFRTTEELGTSGQNAVARALVMGDVDFSSNAYVNNPSNLNFTLNVMAWLTENEDLIAIRPSGKEDPPIVLNDRDKRIIAWFSSLFTVQLVVACGVAVYVLRRKNQ